MSAAKRWGKPAGLLKLASDPVRLAILSVIGDGSMFVSDICANIGLTQPGTSHHLALLRISGLLTSERVAKNNWYTLTAMGRSLLGFATQLLDMTEGADESPRRSASKPKNKVKPMAKAKAKAKPRKPAKAKQEAPSDASESVSTDLP